MCSKSNHYTRPLLSTYTRHLWSPARQPELQPLRYSQSHEAHLLFIPFLPHLSARPLARLIRILRAQLLIPHKGITLPPVTGWLPTPASESTERESVLGFIGYGWVWGLSLVKELIEDPEFLIESEPPSSYGERLVTKLLFVRIRGGGGGGGDVSGIGKALRLRCVRR
ncbi:hypothetical protein SDJN03_06210, partial [Cucurbita argyrosperma subsp. sororia]